MKSQVPKRANISRFICSIEKKMDGTLQGLLTAQRRNQKDGEHYDSSLIYTPMIND